MNKNNSFLFALVPFLLFGCASKPQTPVDLNLSEAVPQSTRVAVAAPALPKVNTFFPGAGCLLCIAIAEGNHSALTKHTQALPPEGLSQIKDEIAALLREQGAEVTVVEEPLDLGKLPKASNKTEESAKLDFTGLKQRFQVDKLVVVNITALGMQRAYAAYVPQGAPRAIFKGEGFMVDLNDNSYEWYRQIDLGREAEGGWDEPPSFPGLTNAYFQVLDEGREAYLVPFRTK